MNQWATETELENNVLSLEFINLSGVAIRDETAEMLDTTFDARERLKDCEYKKLSESCGRIRELNSHLLDFSKSFCEDLYITRNIVRKQNEEIQKLREKLEKKQPRSKCSCGNTYASKSGLKRHQKKTNCPIIQSSCPAPTPPPPPPASLLWNLYEPEI